MKIPSSPLQKNVSCVSEEAILSESAGQPVHVPAAKVNTMRVYARRV